MAAAFFNALADAGKARAVSAGTNPGPHVHPEVVAAMREVDLGHVAILPGLVNAHTHLELSYLRDEVPPASTFVTWVRGVIGARRGQPDPEAPVILAALDRAIADATAFGTAVVGDITNTLVTFAPLVKSELAGVQALGFDADYGSIESGKRARLIAVAVPPGVDDVEEYLVTGIQAEQVQWIGDA